MAASVAEREAAFMAFNAEFERNGFGEAPKGLIDLLKSYLRNGPKPGESSTDLRSRIYKRMWCIMWFGMSIGKDAVSVGEMPTYVYPPSLKRVVRFLLPEHVADHDDPSGRRVYKVNIGDLANAKWPQKAKSRRK